MKAGFHIVKPGFRAVPARAAARLAPPGRLSTSVPGLAAKPVIDCDIVVAEQDVAAASQTLTGLGFKPWANSASR